MPQYQLQSQHLHQVETFYSLDLCHRECVRPAHLHSKAGKHEDKEEEEEEAKKELFPAKDDIPDDPPHAGHQTDQPQGTTGSKHQEHGQPHGTMA